MTTVKKRKLSELVIVPEIYLIKGIVWDLVSYDLSAVLPSINFLTIINNCVAPRHTKIELWLPTLNY